MPRVVLFFLCFFILELLTLIEIGSKIGALATISLMFVAIVVGVFIMKLRARYLINALQGADGKLALQNNVRLLLLPVAGALFIFPGFLADILALLLILPGSDRLLAGFILSRFNVLYFGRGRSFNDGASSASFNSGFTYTRGTNGADKGDVMDGTYTEEQSTSVRLTQENDKERD